MKAGSLKDRIRIERPIADDALDGAGSGNWAIVADNLPANVVDALPSRGERIADGINVAARPTRVRIRFREDVTSAMRVSIGRLLKNDGGEPEWHTDRIAQIITVPATLGRREGLEFMVEDYSSSGELA